VVAVAGGVVEVVQDEHDRAVLGAVEVDEQVEHLDLVGEVEERGGLVEQHQSVPWARAMAIQTRWRWPPDSSSTGRSARSTCRWRHRLGDDRLVGAGPLAEPLLVRVAAAGHEVGHGDALGGDRGCCGRMPSRVATSLVGSRWMLSPSSSTVPPSA
jgi:hypothetical protein